MKKSSFFKNNATRAKGYGIAWFVLSLLFDNINDVIMKHVGQNISHYEVVFFRFLFSTIVLVPFMLYRRAAVTKSMMAIHFIRGALLFFGIALWCTGLGVVKLTMATSINFTIPVFILILATVFLKERFNWIKVLATVGGFIGTMVVMNPTGSDFNFTSITLIVSAFVFAALDIVNKRFVIQESTLNMLFYSGLFVLLWSIVPTIHNWSNPSIPDLFFLFLLGIGGNMILYCLLKSFALIEVSSVAPYRYIELMFAALLGYLIFGEIPHITTVIGAGIIVISTLCLAYEALFANLKKSVKDAHT